APCLERARATIGGPGTIEKRRAVMDPACRVQQLALRADIDVAIAGEREGLAAQRAVVASGLVKDGNVRGNLLVVYDPVKGGGRSISGSRREPGGLQAEAVLGAVDHGPGRTDLGLANGARSLDIDDDAELHI